MRNATANGIGLNGTRIGLGSSSTTFISPLTVKGGVVRVIDSATGDIDTTGGWIEDEKYKAYLIASVTTKTGSFDTTVTRNGHKTVKNTVITKGAGTYIFTDTTPNIVTGLTQASKYAIPLKPSTNYRASIYSKCNGVGTGDGVRLRCYSIKSDGSAYDTYTSTTGALKGTQDWTELAVTFTTGADRTVFRAIYNLVEGADILDGQQVWSDIYSLKVEEVTSITNSSSSPALFYPTVTAVTSTDNIDQSQVDTPGTLGFGLSNSKYRNQQFLPTKKEMTGFIFRKGTETGTFTGDITISIQKDNGSNKPDGVNLITPQVILNTPWKAITVNTDYSITFPKITLIVDGTTKYHMIFTSSTADDSNFTRLYVSTVDNPYANGSYYRSPDFVTFTAETKDLYFKTLYSKNTTNLTVSTDTETVSVTAPTVDGWENGTVVGFDTPLTLAVGANAIYVSSNGADTADGTVDSSLQGIMGGNYVN